MKHRSPMGPGGHDLLPFFLSDPTNLTNEDPIVDPTTEIPTGSAYLALNYQSSMSYLSSSVPPPSQLRDDNASVRLTRRSGFQVELDRPCSKRTSIWPSWPQVISGPTTLLRSSTFPIGNPDLNDASAPPHLGTDQKSLLNPSLFHKEES
ncbi:hypothetical protein U1Q18_037622 [Sarracenia purpurea var. burkii]